MRKTVALVASAAAVVGGLSFAGSSAQAASCSPGPTNPNTGCDVTVTGVVGGLGLTGVRTLGAVTPVALAGTSSLTGAVAVPVVEAAATGANPWSVTASSTALTSGVNSIPASNLSVADTSLPTGGVGCLSLALLVSQRCTITGGGAARALNTTQTLFSVANEDTATAYTGTYTYAGLLSLTVPNGTPAGTYTGTMTLTLVQ
jgi:hypothetical protein